MADAAGWSWSPAIGRWTPNHGLPHLATRVDVSTKDLQPADAFGWWRDTACYEWTPHQPERDSAFTAAATGIIARDAEFYRYRISALAGERSQAQLLSDGHANLSIGIVCSGTRGALSNGDQSVQARRGEVFVHDAGRPSQLAWSDGGGVHLMVRRHIAESIFGSSLPPPSQMAAMIAASPLFAHWRRQMVMLDRLPAAASAADLGFALDQLASLTRFLLNQANPRPRPLRAAAMALIETNLANPRLSPRWLAGQLGCSRASLYRAFAQDGGVAQIIADLRYAEAWRRLAGNRGARVADVAVACGVFDTVNFSRAFRQRFGITPTDARMLLQARP